jgi:5-methylcytosine-specific restriction endonuclease McrA
MIRRSKPLKRSSVPLKRSAPIRRSPLKKRPRKPREGRLTGKAMEALRREVFSRDLYQCQHMLPAHIVWEGEVVGEFWEKCLKSVTWESGHLAHIVPRSKGGKDTAENTVCKCAECHLVREHSYGKSGKPPVPKKERP